MIRKQNMTCAVQQIVDRLPRILEAALAHREDTRSTTAAADLLFELSARLAESTSTPGGATRFALPFRTAKLTHSAGSSSTWCASGRDSTFSCGGLRHDRRHSPQWHAARWPGTTPFWHKWPADLRCKVLSRCTTPPRSASLRVCCCCVLIPRQRHAECYDYGLHVIDDLDFLNASGDASQFSMEEVRRMCEWIHALLLELFAAARPPVTAVRSRLSRVGSVDAAAGSCCFDCALPPRGC